jgi:hypothetical protein
VSEARDHLAARVWQLWRAGQDTAAIAKRLGQPEALVERWLHREMGRRRVNEARGELDVAT